MSGGSQVIELTVGDSDGGVVTKSLPYVLQGVNTYSKKGTDLWLGTGILSATVFGSPEKVEIKYREGSDDWKTFTAAASATNTYEAVVSGLSAERTYEYNLVIDGETVGTSLTFTTASGAQIPNGDLEGWCESGGVIIPFSSAANSYWCTGNYGTATLGKNITQSSTDVRPGSKGKKSAYMHSEYVVVKFAAGNIFVGEFAGLVGTKGGIVNFGRPFTLRPRKLVVWLKYNSGVIDRIDSVPDNDDVKLGDKDRGQVFIAVGDWDYRKFGGTPESPVQVNTTDRSTFFDPKSEGVIGYGSHIFTDSSDGWQRVEIPLEYVSTSRKPTHIIVSCASSMLGDYFTGSSDSKLWVDGMELIY